ncbi:MAG: pyridoxamine 5'-phosphate oxidase family protein, partial [Conexivisphaerales archaeon]|nr:pyridoxamine 5'-phosphate oxidase family protein [Conexivisphaerales archaeon]
MIDARVISLLRKARTMGISVCDEEGPWGIKVYYAMDEGFIFLLEKGSRTLNAILKNPKVSFSVDLNKPDLFIQGEGRVEVLGDPAKHDKERGTLLSKVPEDLLFITNGSVELVRLIPEKMRVTDMSDEPKKYFADF